MFIGDALVRCMHVDHDQTLRVLREDVNSMQLSDRKSERRNIVVVLQLGIGGHLLSNALLTDRSGIPGTERRKLIRRQRCRRRVDAARKTDAFLTREVSGEPRTAFN